MKNFIKIIMMMSLVAFMTACDDDDDTNKPSDMEPGMLTVSDQMISQNMVMVESVTFEQDGWIVIHANKADDSGPVVPDIISEPVFVEAGTKTDVKVPLTSDAMIDKGGSKVWVMLHTDTGVSMDYEFDTDQTLDPPLANLDGDVIIKSIMIEPMEPGMLTVSDQMVSQNMVMVESVMFEEDGWIVVHADASGPVVPEIISEPVFVEAGTKTNVMVPLTSDAMMSLEETKVWVMLHTDTGVSMDYEFDTDQTLDPPLMNLDGYVIIEPILLMPAMIMADDQAVTNSVTLDVNAAADGWIVVHNMAGEGIELPGIIGKTAIKKGMNENVTIMLDNGVTITPGQKLFPMVHIDASPMGEYNFPGVDAPEVFGFNDMGEANIVVTSINVK